MCRRLIYLVCLVFVLSMAANASADLILHWPFDDGSGTTAIDVSGNGRNGTLEGNPQWVAGQIGGALDFGGDGDMVLDEDGEDYINGLTDITIMMWIKSDEVGTDSGFIIFAEPEGNDRRGIRYDSTGSGGGGANVLKYGMEFTSGNEEDESSVNLQTTEWQHVAVTSASGAGLKLYINGVLDTPSDDDGPETGVIAGCTTLIVGKGGKDDGGSEGWNGLIDDVRIYDTVLTADEIQTAMLGSEGCPYALGPVPEDGAIHTELWVSFSWKAGDFVASHDVYLSDNFDDVNDGTGDAFRGSQEATATYYAAGFVGYPYPDGLVPGTTYYWRIDEVNEAEPNSPWKGNVWSFTVPSNKAHDPVPGDGATFLDPENVNLTWTTGFGAKLHYVFFGDNFEDVNDDAATGDFQTATTFSPGILEPEKTYYWRVDESDPPVTYKGDVWSFSTLPDIPITDPNLVGWWKFEAGEGEKIVDWSGQGNHGTMAGAAKMQWVESQFNLGLDFLGDGQGYVELPSGVVTSAKGSILMWVNTTQTSDEGHLWWMCDERGGNGGGGQDEMHITIEDGDDAGKLRYFWEEDGGGSDITLDSPDAIADGMWHHVGATWDLTDGCKLYVDGEQVASASHNTNVKTPVVMRLGNAWDGGRYYEGLMDDVRLFDYAISAAQVSEIMSKGEDPLRAGNPNPGTNSVPGVDEVTPLSWLPGENAAEHDVYFGTDKDAVKAADASDATGVYRGRQGGTTFTPAEPVEWGTGPYYWRIDEINNDGTISNGTVWTFTVADFSLIDDFEDYDTGDNQIWYAWHDGLGYGVPDVGDYFAGNGTGAAVGDETTASYTEETIFRPGGFQSMPLVFDNNKQGYANYSEAELTLTAPRDWTAEGVAELSIWFRGNAASVGSFVEAPFGTYTMTATGADIWTEADEFHFAYKMLTGAGSIIAKVISVEQANDWSKAGVMVRETLGAGSKFAGVYITPTDAADGTSTNGCTFQARLETDVAAISDSAVRTDEQRAIIAPYWVKIERDVAGNFRASFSADGSTWRQMSWNPQSIPMTSTVYVGLALTSHDNYFTCQAVFSNVTTSGNVSAQWANQDIGITSNTAEPLYVAVSNAAGQSAVVVNEDPAAANNVIWTEWVIPLQAFADQGINLTNVDRIAIGLGTWGNTAIPGGSGKMYFDDIRLYRLREAAEE